MTQTKYIIVLDCSSQKVFILPVEHNPSDDLEVAVFEAYDKYNDSQEEYHLKDSQCSWMELDDDFSTDDIISAYQD